MLSSGGRSSPRLLWPLDRVRASIARSKQTRNPAIANLNKDEAVEPTTIAVITRSYGVVVTGCLGSTCDTYDCLVNGYCGRGQLMVEGQVLVWRCTTNLTATQTMLAMLTRLHNTCNTRVLP